MCKSLLTNSTPDKGPDARTSPTTAADGRMVRPPESSVAMLESRITRSLPTSAYDPGLLREQETPLMIGNNWFLDQEIPAGGFIRIQDSSQVWEERVNENHHDGSLTTCLDPGRGWTITTGGWNFLKKQECWEGHEQALVTTIRKETKRTEELEKAGYRSPTWAVLRALQQINSATRMEGEAAMSAPPFIQSADEEIYSSGGGKKDQR